jgi:cytochrome c oxidase subunit 2
MNGSGWFHLLPDASANARPLDELWWAMVGLCALVALGVFVVMFVFCIRYRKGRPADRHLAKETLPVELTWTAVPFLIFMGVFAWSLTLYAHSRTPPSNAETIYVVAKQWMWKVQHPGGQREINTLHVPMGVPIRLMMTSQDVIHSFFVPAFRVKQDVLPDRYTQLWFTATEAGDYPLYCTQYCGLDHSKMGGQVIVMAPRAYARWLDENNTGTSLAAQGPRCFAPRAAAAAMARMRRCMRRISTASMAASCTCPTAAPSAPTTATSTTRSCCPTNRSSRATRRSCRRSPAN